MLLAQPFDPFKEQQRKVPLLARCRIFSRARRALSELKNRMHANRQLRAFIMPDHHFMLPTPPQQIAPPQRPWYCCYGCCYDPYMSTIMLPPPPPPFPIHPHQLPYFICVHFSPPPQYQQQQNHNKHAHHNEISSLAESTLYSSSSSMYSGDEKELIEEVEYEPHHRHYYPQQQENRSVPVMTRSNSDIMPERRRVSRPSFNRWNSSNGVSGVYYN